MIFVCASILVSFSVPRWAYVGVFFGQEVSSEAFCCENPLQSAPLGPPWIFHRFATSFKSAPGRLRGVSGAPPGVSRAPPGRFRAPPGRLRGAYDGAVHPTWACDVLLAQHAAAFSAVEALQRRPRVNASSSPDAIDELADVALVASCLALRRGWRDRCAQIWGWMYVFVFI